MAWEQCSLESPTLLLLLPNVKPSQHNKDNSLLDFTYTSFETCMFPGDPKERPDEYNTKVDNNIKDIWTWNNLETILHRVEKDTTLEKGWHSPAVKWNTETLKTSVEKEKGTPVGYMHLPRQYLLM